MADERVVIQFDAQTAAVVKAIEGIEGRLKALGKAHGRTGKEAVKAAKASEDSLRRLHRMMSVELVSRGIRGLIGAWRELGRHMDSTAPQMRRLSSAWDEFQDSLAGTMQAALESSGVMDQLTTALSSVTEDGSDANNALQNLATVGMQGLVGVTAIVIEGVLGVASAITAMIDAAVIAYEWARRELARAEFGNENQRLLDLQGRIEAIDAEIATAEAAAAEVERPRQQRRESLTRGGGPVGPAPVEWDDPQIAIDRLRERREALVAESAQLTNAAADAAERFQAIDTSGDLEDAIADLESDMTGFADLMQQVQVGAGAIIDQLGESGIVGGSGDRGERRAGNTWLALAINDVSQSMLEFINDSPGFMTAVERIRQSIETVPTIETATGKRGASGAFGLSLLNTGAARGPILEMEAAEKGQGVAGTGNAISDTISGAFSSLPGDVSSALGDVSSSIGQFISGTEGAFDSLGESLRASFASTLGGIGNALTQGALEAALTTTSALGPLGLLAGLGLALGIASGLLGGSGGGTTANAASARAAADVFSAIRSDSGGGGSTTVYHTSIGTYFGDPERDDNAARGVVGGMRRARRMGELPR